MTTPVFTPAQAEIVATFASRLPAPLRKDFLRHIGQIDLASLTSAQVHAICGSVLAELTRATYASRRAYVLRFAK